MFRETIAGVAIGMACLVCYTAGSYNKQDECRKPQVGRTYQLLPPVAEPAVNLISCDKSSLHSSLEHLRVCHARFHSEQTK